MTLYEQLMEYPRDSLLEIGRLKGLHGISRLRKADLADRLAKHMLSPAVMMRYFQWLRDDEIAILPEAPELIFQSEYAKRMGEVHFVVLPEVMDGYKMIDTPEFHEKRRTYSFILSCLRTMEALYGAAPVEIMMKLAGTAPELEITKSMLLEAVSELPGELQNYTMADEVLFCIDVEEWLGHLLKDQGEVPFYIPTRSEIETIGRLGWLPETPGVELLWRQLRAQCGDDCDDAAETVCLLWKCICAGAELRQVMEFLENSIGAAMAEMSDAEKIMLIEPVCQMYENTRLLVLRGHTRKELNIGI